MEKFSLILHIAEARNRKRILHKAREEGGSFTTQVGSQIANFSLLPKVVGRKGKQKGKERGARGVHRGAKNTRKKKSKKRSQTVQNTKREVGE